MRNLVKNLKGSKMKKLLVAGLAVLPSLGLAHSGHGEHILEVPAEPFSISSQAVVASLVIASVIVLAVKKYKSKN